MTVKKSKLIMEPFTGSVPGAQNVYITPEGPIRTINGQIPMFPLEYSGWQEEELSWHDNCYIHSGLNPFIFHEIKGDDFLEFMEAMTISTYRQFPIGKARHAVFCNEEGKIRMDGILVRRGEDEFLAMHLLDPAVLNQEMGNKYKFVSRDVSNERFFYQLCGPRSLEVIEAAARQDFHELKFMYSTDAVIDGADVLILRTSMAGTLGYEIHGKAEDAVKVYKRVMQVGEDYDLHPIGRHAYRNTHTEGSIAQGGIHFAFYNQNAVSSTTGSFGEDCPYRYASPIDVGWEKMISFKHDFIGKAALQSEMNSHHNTLVHLIWNKEDILKVASTWFEKDSCDVMDMVEDFDYVHSNRHVHLDAVYDHDRLIGAASGRMLSPKNHEMMSLCVIDQDYAAEGKKVEVLWESPGSRQMRIRATVLPVPYIKECRNDSFDVSLIPRPVF
ncbi:MAG: hypothetical protein ACOX8G_06715 [Eubacterium sp.]|jgi:glycine cleavage system aminomethyltransferase T